MKKIFLSFILLLNLFFISNTAHAQYEIYLTSIKLDVSTYEVGDKISGNFDLHNLSVTSQSDIYYNIYTGSYDEKTLQTTTVQGLSTKVGPVYLNGKDKKNIKFDYTLPLSLSGKAAVKIVATLKDGTLVGQDFLPITITGSAKSEQVNIEDVYLRLNEQDLDVSPGVGPMVYDKETISYIYSVSTTTKEYILTPTLNLYNRADNAEALVKTIILPEIKTSKTEVIEVKVDLPTDMDPLVYYGVISFTSKDMAEMSPVNFRYIIAGPIATIRNINTDVLETVKGTEIPFTVAYGRQPIDEIRPEKQIASATTTLFVTIKNEKNEIVGSIEKQLDPNKDTINLSITSKVKSKSLSFEAEIKSLDGKVLSTYKTSLPPKEVTDTKKEFNVVYYYIAILGSLLILFSIFRYKHKFGLKKINSKTKKMLMIAMLFLSGYVGVKAEAEVLFNNSQTGFGITSISSPYQSGFGTNYSPGQAFNLSFNVNYSDCNNNVVDMKAYAANRTDDGWNGDINWWQNGGNATLLLNQRKQDACKYTWYGKKKCRHDYPVQNYTLNKLYYASNVPGYHSVFFLVNQKANSGNKIILARQTYCVVGAGICAGEPPIIPDLCPNLGGVQATIPAGLVLTNGQCVYPITYTCQNTQMVGIQNGIEVSRGYDTKCDLIETCESTSMVSTRNGLVEQTKSNDPRCVLIDACVNKDMVSTRNGVEQGRIANDTRCDTKYECVNRNLVGTQNGKQVSSDVNSSCNLEATCKEERLSNDRVAFTVIPSNDIATTTYQTQGYNDKTQNPGISWTYTITNTKSLQTMDVTVTDSFDNTSKTVTCSMNTYIKEADKTDPTIPFITITKKPLVTLDKGGDCELSWKIENMPEGTKCTLKRDGILVNTTVNSTSTGSYTQSDIQSNTEFKITCAGPSLNPSLTESAICRVNPEIREI